MQLFDLFHLSFQHFRAHFKRTFFAVLAIGLTFGLIFTLNLWLQGLENTYRHYANLPTNGQVVILAHNYTDSVLSTNAAAPSKVSRAEMIADIETYGGTVLLDSVQYGPYSIPVLPPALVQSAIEIPLDQTPAGALPILASTFFGEQLLGQTHPQEFANITTKQSAYEELRSALLGHTFIDTDGTEYFVVGMAPGSFHIRNLSFRQLDPANNNLLNPLLEYFNVPSGTSIILDNNSSANSSAATQDSPGSSYDAVVAIFDNNADAYRYFQNGAANFPNTTLDNKQYFAQVLAGFSPEIDYFFHILNCIVGIISLILTIIASFITFFTSIRLTDYDRENVSLYYSLGATKHQIMSLFSCYFFELMLGALIFAYAAASLIVVLFSLINQSLLGVQAELAFSLPEAPATIWYGINFTTILTVLVILLLPIICIFINRKRLSPSRTAP